MAINDDMKTGNYIKKNILNHIQSELDRLNNTKQLLTDILTSGKHNFSVSLDKFLTSRGFTLKTFTKDEEGEDEYRWIYEHNSGSIFTGTPYVEDDVVWIAYDVDGGMWCNDPLSSLLYDEEFFAETKEK